MRVYMGAHANTAGKAGTCSSLTQYFCVCRLKFVFFLFSLLDANKHLQQQQGARKGNCANLKINVNNIVMIGVYNCLFVVVVAGFLRHSSRLRANVLFINLILN